VTTTERAGPTEAPATSLSEITAVVERARAAYRSGVTRPLEWREQTLRRLRAVLVDRTEELELALRADLGKPGVEAFAADIGFTIADIDHTLAHLRSWAAPRSVATPLTFQPASSKIVREPLGVAVVIAPWNYPVQLLLAPMVAAIAAGNSVVGKPSEVAPATAAELGRVIDALGSDAVGVVQGGVTETTELLAQRVDHVFYTGNGTVGRIVMRAAAEHLTPVTLELGGKSPTIVTAKADLAVAAKRIAWGKFLNAGQTCVAPDYVLVEAAVHGELVERLVAAVREFYGEDPQRSPDYARIVDERHVERLQKLLGAGTVATGGVVDVADRYVAPTVLTDVTRDDPVMTDEIFGPVLPVIAVESVEAAIAFVDQGEKPLALYVFSGDDAEVDRVLAGTSSGGVCVNGTVMHLSNPKLPFGGVGESGMGAYHGEAGFLTFTHERAVLARSTRLDPPIMYPPYSPTKESVLRRAFLLPDPRDVVSRAWSRLRHR
jgi:aldehyde dehydrogenase (NAD+)